MKKNLFVIVFLHCFYSSNAQWIFQREYGNNRNERCQSAYPTIDGGLLLNGATTSFGSGDVDPLIIKTDLQGNILWSKTCGASANEIPNFAAETFDHKIVFAGSTDASAVGGSSDVLVFKTDSVANFLWAKSFGGVNNENAVKIIELPDSGYAITGTTESYGSGASDIFFIKMNENGDTAFTALYGTPNNEIGKSMAPTSDGGFIICGKNSEIINGALVFKAILLRINSTGNILWAKEYGDSLYQEAQSVMQTADGGFVVCGSRDFTSNGNYDILLFRTESSGNIVWSKTYGGNKGEGSYTVNLNADGTYVLSGYTNSMGYGHRGDDSTNIFLMKTDANGDTIWTRTYGGDKQDEAFLSAKTPDGGFIISGFSDYHTSDSSQMLVIKTDSMGFSGCNEFTSHPVIVNDLLAVTNSNYSQHSGMTMNSITLTTSNRVISDSTYCLLTAVNEIPINASFNIFPNPVSETLFVKNISSALQNNNLYKKNSITIYNLIGEKIIVPAFLYRQENYFELNVSSLKEGMYLLEILTDNEISVQKFIKY
jgi:hypothetical protein